MLSARINRLCSGVVNVASTVPALLKAESHVRPLIATMDRASIASIIRTFTENKRFADGRKYLKLNVYLRDSLARTVALGLDRSPPLRVLDLGSGAGYFLVACRHFGHSVIGFDLPGNGFYAAMFRALKLDRVESAIMPFAPLKGLDGQFDLITAYAVTFSKQGRIPGATEWSKAEWHYFLNDLRRILRPGGRLFLRMNISEVTGLHDRAKYDYFYSVPDGYSVEVLNRREVLFRLQPPAHDGTAAPISSGTK